MRHRTRITAAALAAVSVTAPSATAGLIQSTIALTEPASAAASGDERTGFGLATVDVTGIPSWDSLGSPNNVVMFIWIGPFNVVTGVGWDVVLQTIAPGSWRYDMRMLVTNSANAPQSGFLFGPAGSDGPGGPTHYSSDGAILKLANFLIPNVQALADGLIRLEFLEIYDDAPGEIDGVWLNGQVKLQTGQPIPPVPSPSTVGLLVYAGVLALRLRKRDSTGNLPSVTDSPVNSRSRAPTRSAGM